jgi:hypothetical protein
MRALALWLLGAVVLVGGDAVDATAARDAWAQGRPGEALPYLLADAQRAGTWQAWTDAGLCAADAGDHGEAVAALWTARRLAPAAPEPAAALVTLSAATPVLWTDRLGPVAWVGAGWWAIPLLAAAGALAGWAIARREPRAGLAMAAILAVVVPGVVAGWRDRLDPHRIVRTPTQLLDATGAAVAPLAAGTPVRLAGEPWAGRSAVRTADGRAGFVDPADLR